MLHLSSAGNWIPDEPNLRWFSRFPRAEALSRAEAAVDGRTINERTFGEVEAWVASGPRGLVPSRR